MAWPKGKKRNALASVNSDVLERPEFNLVLAVKQIRGGSFHGLWQLYRLEGDRAIAIGSETTRLLVINMARNEIARCSI